MFKYLFFIVLILHGLIHAMGFAKAFGYGNITQLTKDISKPAGLLWLTVALLFIAAAVAYLLKNQSWPAIAIIAAFISQTLIISSWLDARWGSIANIIILLVAVASWGNLYFESHFKKDVQLLLQQQQPVSPELLTEKDILLLPKPVQQYIRYSGALNKPKLKNVRIQFEGKMRERGKYWFSFRSVQYNFFDPPARLFFMKAKMFGIVVPAYHQYQHATAAMDVKLFGLIPLVKVKGIIMNKAETVTVFNDMCLMAPASLTGNNIQWTPVDSVTAKAVFTVGAISIAATLCFNEAGQLVNFESDDRYAIGDMQQYRFSTPVSEYKSIHERNIFQFGETIWHYPEGAFVYGQFNVISIDYNVAE